MTPYGALQTPDLSRTVNFSNTPGLITARLPQEFNTSRNKLHDILYIIVNNKLHYRDREFLVTVFQQTEGSDSAGSDLTYQSRPPAAAKAICDTQPQG
jgi:hypothetical protein